MHPGAVVFLVVEKKNCFCIVILLYLLFCSMKKLLFSLLVLTTFFSFTSATTTYLTKTENSHAYKVMKVVLDGTSKIVVSAVDNANPAQSLQTLMTNV